MPENYDDGNSGTGWDTFRHMILFFMNLHKRMKRYSGNLAFVYRVSTAEGVEVQLRMVNSP